MEIYPVKCIYCGHEWVIGETKEEIVCPQCNREIDMKKAMEYKKDNWL